VLDGDRRSCAACGTLVRSYQLRFHPPESSLFERCIGASWCSGCRLYCTALVHVPRATTLVDELASLPEDQRDRLLRKEAALIAYLDRIGRPG
jgi:hypothetical protein